MEHPYDEYGAEEPFEVHHRDCDDTPDEPIAGDMSAAGVENAADGQYDVDFDLSCGCLDGLLR